ncbi:hypothetical protein [Cellulosimicrobium cellulans]|uniref:hypothetical protein n=1 Tax=Cellulosimicrobium cellulans TaxID=1710 RepID=UPI0011874179|nr:hypothetical protein [Cellulosimicrobium cellulans]
MSDLHNLAATEVAALCHLSGGTRPAIVAIAGISAEIATRVSSMTGTPVKRLDRASFASQSEASQLARTLVKESATMVFQGAARGAV